MVKVWQAISLDAITGDEQNGATDWKRIYDQFQQNNTSGIFHSQISVTHRWQTIQTSCNKWVSCLEHVERFNPSGANAQDKPKKKGGKPGKAFALQHCWAFLQYDEKWRVRNNDVPPKSKKSSKSFSLVDDDCVDLDDSDDEDSDGRRSPTPSSATSSRKRPPSRKAENEKLKKEGDNTYKESVDNMMLSRKELAYERKEFNTKDG
ncbi:hypothetical protein BAE44_0017982 [Dichanthelium oligosanthes]|uniref:No apical meristem-associated C-terminal domain-containing protein n=1 Tax=Dichanthelium oligosanthes TaxID=888268 RepID=A0A1E5V767_9POAL|nr:hypothetical protein BAE44_0017982 [Dichanthelium oligosanthes]